MKTFLLLLRGVNVGGKNTISMAVLRKRLEDLGYEKVATFINSGNVVLDAKEGAAAVQARVEAALTRSFKLDSERIRVLALTPRQLEAVVENRPKGFGERPDTYHSDAIFLMGIPVAKAMPVFSPREGVDAVWPGKGVVYSQRLSAERTKSRLSKIVASPLYKSMTIRSWSTTLKLRDLLQRRAMAA